MIRKRWAQLLVPLDGSALAEHALGMAATLAHRLSAVLHLVTVQVAEPRTAAEQRAEPHPTAPAVRRELRSYLAAKAEELGITHGVECSCEVLHGPPAEALAGYVRSAGIGLVVMTAHGRSGASRCWIGSVADRLLRQVSVPVLLLRPGSGTTPQRIYRVLVALDGSAGAADVLAQALALGAVAPDTEYTLAEIVEPPHAGQHPGPDPAPTLARREERAATDLAHRAERLRRGGVVVTAQVVVAERIGEQLLELAGALRSDLIAVGTRRPRRHTRAVLGSVADKVVRGARQPVLVVPLRGRAPHSPRRAARAHAVSTGPT